MFRCDGSTLERLRRLRMQWIIRLEKESLWMYQSYSNASFFSQNVYFFDAYQASALYLTQCRRIQTSFIRLSFCFYFYVDFYALISSFWISPRRDWCFFQHWASRILNSAMLNFCLLDFWWFLMIFLKEFLEALHGVFSRWGSFLSFWKNNLTFLYLWLFQMIITKTF